MDAYITQYGQNALLNKAQLTTYLDNALSIIRTDAQYHNAITECGLADLYLNFNGASYVSFGKQPQYEMGTNDFTLEAWVKYPTINSDGTFRL